jgi:hypothetical protein
VLTGNFPWLEGLDTPASTEAFVIRQNALTQRDKAKLELLLRGFEAASLPTSRSRRVQRLEQAAQHLERPAPDASTSANEIAHREGLAAIFRLEAQMQARLSATEVRLLAPLLRRSHAGGQDGVDEGDAFRATGMSSIRAQACQDIVLRN